ncbi:MAG: hypothetical protein DI564_08370 [Rhodanobacter denitrificans]|uniref:Thioredoxin domain-containing protein n=1 Tax=Rhodanobacter denitrificans TaxID=666685 RepID=A0A2W5KKB1_9GAMM|nr:MAG: hypothetical protein DI564_08370 [Rhodanobacter denitrificans]
MPMILTRPGWILAFALGSALASTPAPRDLQADYDALVAVQTRAVDRSEAERGATIAASYRERFGTLTAAELDALPDASLDLLFRAAEIPVGYTLDPYYAEQMNAAYERLAARSRVEPRHRRSMFEAWIMLRRFDAARRIADAAPDAGHLPLLHETPVPSGAPALWAPDDGADALTRRPADLTRPRIVVVSHPLCGFSQNAARQIAADPELAPRFADRSLWLLPQTATLDVEQVRAWQRAHAPFRMAYVDLQRHWPGMDEWGTPTFYFFKDGRVVHKVVGWPAQGRKADLLEGLARIGG